MIGSQRRCAVSLTHLSRVVAIGTLISGLLLVPTSAQAAGDPTVIAVHRTGAVDISGQSTFGTIAKLSLPAGNWLITATATVQGTQPVLATYCDLVAGADTYEARTDPTSNGTGSLAAMELQLAHHFAKSGSVILKCENGYWIGDVLIRDVHVTAVSVAQLTAGDVTYGSGSPTGVFQQNSSQRLYFDTAVHDVQDMTLPAGTWLVRATGWGFGNTDGDRVDCSLASGSSTADYLVEDFEDIAARSIGLEGIVTLSAADHVYIYCKDTYANWSIRGSAISALKVGTLKYAHFGSALVTSGTGSPTVIGAYSDDAGPVAPSQALQSIASVSIPAGAWFATSHVSLISGASSARVTCQLQFNGETDQGRVIEDASSYALGWLGMSLTRKVSNASKASIACGQSASANQVLFLHDKVFAIKAGSLKDTILN